MHVAFLITAHLPYLRRAGPAPVGEEPLHELIASSLVPLINLLRDVRAFRLEPRVALAFSPLLLEQLADPVVQKHFVLWMEARLAASEGDLAQYERDGNDHAAYLTRFYLERERDVLTSFNERFNRNLTDVLRDLCATGVIEPLAGAASHAYLPLLGREESVRAQIEQGMLSVARHLGRPQGLWLTDCGWRPGLEQIAAAAGMRYVVADASSLPPGEKVEPHWVLPRRLSALFCDELTSRYVWSADLGYAADAIYRSTTDPYHAQGVLAPLPYDPYHAFRRAQEHANHFTALLVAQARQHDKTSLLLLPLDARLLGQFWFEGSVWLKAVLTLCATLPDLKLTTPGAYLRAHRPGPAVELQPGSWGMGSDHRSWQGLAAMPYWSALHHAEDRLIALVRQRLDTYGDAQRLLNQAARELLLAQCSDWPLLLNSGAPPEEINEQWQTYLGRCERLCALALRPGINRADHVLLEQLEELDGPFPDLNYRIFA